MQRACSPFTLDRYERTTLSLHFVALTKARAGGFERVVMLQADRLHAQPLGHFVAEWACSSLAFAGMVCRPQSFREGCLL